jgi:hypothetical protein
MATITIMTQATTRSMHRYAALLFLPGMRTRTGIAASPMSTGMTMRPIRCMLMAIVFAASTIITYVVLCVYSAAGLQRVSLGPVERYGEVISGAFIALVGVVFWLLPVM